MNCQASGQSSLSYLELYDELIKICQNIAQNVNIPNQWVFIYFFSKNWQINNFADNSMKNQIYKPSETQTSKIYIGLSSMICNLCKRNRKIMIRNLCEHIYCWKCLQNYILTHYSLKVQKTVLPLCIYYEQCSQMISHEVVNQLLNKNERLMKQYKSVIVQGFVRNQKQRKMMNKKDTDKQKILQVLYQQN